MKTRLDTTEKILKYFADAGKSPYLFEKPHDFAWRMVCARIAYAHMTPDILYFVLNNCALTRLERRRIHAAISEHQQFEGGAS